ncbi:MAG: GNAT family N-acetyltransferase [Pseudomonadota bacterium]
MISPATLNHEQKSLLRPPFRRARKGDANEMAELINFAGEGLPVYLWSSLSDGSKSVWDIGCERAQREAGSFSYRNTVVRESNGKAVAALVGYLLPNEADPAVYRDMPAMFVPLQELEDLALSTWYINVLAAYPEHRSQGYGSQLLKIAEELGRESRCTGLSIIVSDANTRARALYERSGYSEKASREMVKGEWKNDGKRWVLLTRQL